MEISGFVLFWFIFVLIPPTVIKPLLEARHSENTRFYPFNGECRLNNYYSKFDYLLGAKPNIPLAFC